LHLQGDHGWSSPNSETFVAQRGPAFLSRQAAKGIQRCFCEAKQYLFAMRLDVAQLGEEPLTKRYVKEKMKSRTIPITGGAV
jgi:hypothetical protein